ncbi:unnamed protein product [Peronospora farinosa]|uniref:Uncharacterized protein n=1 Tax=Peronospora farinosa TaxID=134698 RepID=A0ABN8CC21_9STRA|nr:unnamed protein product [Peronospora farinosa]
MAAQIFCNIDPHLWHVRQHFRCLSNNRDVDITDAIAFGFDTAPGLTQQAAAVRPFKGRIGVRKQLADIAHRHCAQQRVSQRMQRHIAIGMGDKTLLKRDPHTANH